jgi:hypothetical protein
MGGNVGVGTTSPGTKLEIQTSATNDGIRITQTGTSAAAIWMNNTSAGGHHWAMFSRGAAGGAGDFSIYDNSAASHRLYILAGGNVGIGTTAPTALLSVNGDANKAVGGGLWGTFSDIRLKKDTSAFKDGLSVIKKIHPVRYRYNGKTGIRDTSSLNIGVIAQQIQPVAPYTVGTYMAKLDTADAQETQLLNYNGNALLYLFVYAFKELEGNFVCRRFVLILLFGSVVFS